MQYCMADGSGAEWFYINSTCIKGFVLLEGSEQVFSMMLQEDASDGGFDGPVDTASRPHGHGVLRAGGRTYEGRWRHGAPVPGVWLVMEGRTKYQGEAVVVAAAEAKAAALVIPHGKGTRKFPDGSVFMGQWKMGLRDGPGTLITAAETVEGVWKDDQFVDAGASTAGASVTGAAAAPAPPRSAATGLGWTGRRRLALPSGSVYEGDFVGGKRHGVGTYTDANTGCVYDGEWRLDLRHGTGGLHNASGKLLYHGSWVRDKFHGTGKQFNPVHKWAYEGEFANGKFQGMGKWTASSGETYTGGFVRGQREGHGCWKKGSQPRSGRRSAGEQVAMYVGGWRGGQRHGDGQEMEPNGDTFEGTFKDGKRHGHGVLSRPSLSQTFEGEWAGGMPVVAGAAEWTLRLSNGDKYQGPVKDAVDWAPHGAEGTMVFADGSGTYRGGFRDGLQEGRGTFYHSSGDVEEAEWQGGVTSSLLSLLADD